jgi:hypothetical protein
MMEAMRMSTLWLCPLVILAMLSSWRGRPADRASSQPEHAQLAGPVDPDPRVGAIFYDGGTLHGCTGWCIRRAET